MLQPDGAGFAAYLDGAPADAELRTPLVTSHVSAVSAVPVVREWVNAKLRELARAGVGVVVDGRDIGTVVFPDADLKVFLTATPEARARRRLEQRGAAVDADELAREAERLALRDRADASRRWRRCAAPHDAVEVDTTSHLVRGAGARGSSLPPAARWPTSGTLGNRAGTMHHARSVRWQRRRANWLLSSTGGGNEDDADAWCSPAGLRARGSCLCPVAQEEKPRINADSAGQGRPRTRWPT